MLLGTFACGILVPEMSGDVSEHSSWPPQDGPCQTRGLCEPWTPGGGGGGGVKGEERRRGRGRRERMYEVPFTQDKHGPIQMAHPPQV